MPLRARSDNGFHLPRSRTGGERSPRARGSSALQPRKPHGHRVPAGRARGGRRFCRENGLFLVADEVYREFVYDDRTSTSVLSLPGFEHVAVLVDSLSKRFSACGARVGCLVTCNRDVTWRPCARRRRGFAPRPGPARGLAATKVPPDYAKGIVREYQARRDVLFEGLSRIPGVFLRKPEGAFYLVARLPIEDAEDFAAWLLTDFASRARR